MKIKNIIIAIVVAGFAVSAHAQGVPASADLQKFVLAQCEDLGHMAQIAAQLKLAGLNYNDYMAKVDQAIAKDPRVVQSRSALSKVGVLVFAGSESDPLQVRTTLQQHCLRHPGLFLSE